MRLPHVVLLAAALAAPVGFAGEAAAQGFFERLFGVRPAPAPVPPGSLPQGRPLPPAPGPAPLPADPGQPPAPMQPAAPPPPKPIVLKPPTEDGVVGRELKLNGNAGSLRIERAGQSLRAQVALQGAKISQPTEACAVKLGGGEPLALTAQGRPDGLPRYQLDAPMCPLMFDVVEGGILVSGPAEACMIQEADCRMEPRGMWGPEPGTLLPKAREIEDARGAADRAVRENYKALTQKAGPQGMRSVVSEQAAFSSEREQLCRSYAREGAHGFCNTRFTEARAVTLAARLGVLPQPETRSAQPAQPAQTERPRRTAPRPEAQAPAPFDPMYLRDR